jgi:hypothetical protein
MYVKIIVSMLRTKWVVGAVSAGRTELHSGESESGSCACVHECYVRDKIEKETFAFLGFFIDDSVMTFEKLDVNIFEWVHSSTFVDWEQ